MGTEMPALGAGLSGHSDIPAVHGDVAPGEMVISPSVPRAQDPETETDRETGTKGNPEIEKPGLPPAEDKTGNHESNLRFEPEAVRIRAEGGNLWAWACFGQSHLHMACAVDVSTMTTSSSRAPSATGADSLL